MIQLLIVDDDRQTRFKVRTAVEKEQMHLDEAEDGLQALKQLRRKEYDLILSDILLPELDGVTVLRQVRKSSDIPFIFLSSRSGEPDKLKAFSAGADDYVTKPFFASELVARIHVLLERCNKMIKRSFLSAAGITVNLDAREVLIDGISTPLSPREYDLLVFFMENPNQAHTRETLLDEVWGHDFDGTDRTIDTHVKSLRSRLRPYNGYVATVWGVGYRFGTGV